jgi:pyruvate formate lyase activating enzyme
MENVEWVEVQPFHQMGAFKWRAKKIGYQQAATPPATAELTTRVINQFPSTGRRVR